MTDVTTDGTTMILIPTTQEKRAYEPSLYIFTSATLYSEMH